MLRQMLRDSGLDSVVECESKGSRDYNVGEGPAETVLAAAHELGVALPEHFSARHFDHEQDIVRFDLVLTLDKYTAADVLREVSSYDLINRSGNYSSRVRRLGEWHPELALRKEPDAQDIDDPLYGNEGGEEEKAAVLAAAGLIRASCEGLVRQLLELRAAAGDVGFAATLRERVGTMEKLDWLVPPLLQSKSQSMMI